MKKVCFFMHSPFTLGGEQRVVTVLANYLIENGYDVFFVLTDKNRLIDYNVYKMNSNIKVVFINKYNILLRRIFRKVFMMFRYISCRVLQNQSYVNFLDKRLLINIFNKYSFDYIIGVSSDYFAKLALIKNDIKYSKIISWQHSTFESYFKTKKHRLYNQKNLVDEIKNNSLYYVVQTKYDKKMIKKEFGINAVVINNPNTFKNNIISNLMNKTFLAIGRFDYIKGFDLLIEAFNIFSVKNKDYKLFIVGSGKEKDNYIKLINKYNLSDRVFVKDKTDKVEDYYLQSCAYMMTSRYEGWGMVATEAMQFGLPIISFDINSSKEIFSNYKCGILVESFDVKKLALAMENIINDDLKEYSKQSIARVKDFDIEIIGKKWIDLLK